MFLKRALLFLKHSSTLRTNYMVCAPIRCSHASLRPVAMTFRPPKPPFRLSRRGRLFVLTHVIRTPRGFMSPQVGRLRSRPRPHEPSPAVRPRPPRRPTQRRSRLYCAVIRRGRPADHGRIQAPVQGRPVERPLTRIFTHKERSRPLVAHEWLGAVGRSAALASDRLL